MFVKLKGNRSVVYGVWNVRFAKSKKQFNGEKEITVNLFL